MRWSREFFETPCAGSPVATEIDREMARADGGSAPGETNTTADDVGTGSVTAPANVPPTNSAASLEAWLATGEYKSWVCEATTHPARAGSGHTRNRICSNPTLSSATGTGEYPIGAAGVKELIDGAGAITGYAVYVKKQPGAGEGWFWYERVGSSTYANGLGVSLCVGCHSGAPRDSVFTHVK